MAAEGSTRTYGLDELAYHEQFGDVRHALERERQIKGWRRNRKIELIESANWSWEDLAGAIAR